MAHCVHVLPQTRARAGRGNLQMPKAGSGQQMGPLRDRALGSSRSSPAASTRNPDKAGKDRAALESSPGKLCV